ncbi:MAG TPA: carboxylesterase family protein [Stenotrophomonas sp.]|nr:carboxylesterase family protein [Stenotrophomonas sp.]
MSRIAGLMALVLSTGIVLLPARAAAHSDTRPDVRADEQVTIEGGRVQGRRSDGVLVFKGIPYAAPPVGALRWRAPQPVPSWQGVREARAYGPDCMQKPFATDDAPLTTDPAEDCLYANVWRPADASAPLPVLVWIHGGGFVNGGASPPSYAGKALARQGVLVFSFNYRLGRFGTFAHPQLGRAGADAGQLGNYGFMDQIAALQWLQRNIAAFGGDPTNVTVMGESAGVMSVHALLTSPLARGLFHKAVILSGGQPAARGTLAEAERAGLRFAQSQGIAGDDPQAIVKLRALPAEAIVGDLNLATLDASTAAGSYTFPFADGRVAVDMASAYRDGRFAHVPLMVGATADDIGGADGFMIAGARETADLFASAGQPTWYYRFGYVAQATRPAHPNGAAHASDIPYFLNTVGIRYGGDTRPADQAIAATTSAYLINFLRTGNPNSPNLPAWRPHTSTQDGMLTIGRDGTIN